MARAMNKGEGDEADDSEARAARDLAEGAAVDDQIASQRTGRRPARRQDATDREISDEIGARRVPPRGGVREAELGIAPAPRWTRSARWYTSAA